MTSSDHGADWARYWRAPDRPLEAMHAHFERHVYHRHSHDTYSFGVTEAGAQAFTCRGSGRVSAAGMVMAFNPDEPHDGHAASELGFTYRIVHLGPDLITDLLDDDGAPRAGLPLFVEPVVHDPVLATALRRLHGALLGGASRLAQDERLHATVRALTSRAALHAPGGPFRANREPERALARRVRDVLHDQTGTDLGAAELARRAGCSRYAAYRAFTASYGMAPSDYQRQVRLRTARGLLADGLTPAEVAVAAGFADQAHLTRWFSRYYGITPGAYRLAATR